MSTHSLATGVPGEITAPGTPIVLVGVQPPNVASPRWALPCCMVQIPQPSHMALMASSPEVRDINDRHTLLRQLHHDAVCSPLSPTVLPQNAPQALWDSGLIQAPLGARIACSPSAVPRAAHTHKPSFVMGSWCPEPCLCPCGWATAFATVQGEGQPCHHGSCMPGTCTWHQHTATPGQGRPAHSALLVLPQALRAQKSFEF